ncbi:hypothetical protein PRIPAC_82552 [Pristionchus pacificus]|uniref:Uncharacterized protein n=1 Tax=Pristionchus pacificus TaxID=54126 RepID=A0A2A6C2N5_PRIPA|nr:hypothetical protein PRIPAC_82552 [Pristionchus pacificus]|eukprot:PDM72400.1 hypothetical protein PRIPAC_38834 [Pristionchus pacificus]
MRFLLWIGSVIVLVVFRTGQCVRYIREDGQMTIPLVMQLYNILPVICLIFYAIAAIVLTVKRRDGLISQFVLFIYVILYVTTVLCIPLSIFFTVPAIRKSTRKSYVK